MLIRFIVENFTSFAGQQEISLVKGRMRMHPEHLVGAPGSDMQILRAGVVYGANASGKSNLVRAISFARNLIVNGTQPMARIPVKPFLLDPKLKAAPTTMQFSFCNEGKCYTYGFKADARRIHEEWLYEIAGKKETLLFERTTKGDEEATVSFAPHLKKCADDRTFLQLIARGTRPNQLFLSESIQRNVKQFGAAYRWFATKLVVLFPETRALGIEFAFRDKNRIAPVFMDLLKAFDTGIVAIEADEVLLDGSVPDIPDSMKEDLERMVRDEKTNVFVAGPSNMRYAVRRNDDGELVALKLKAKHPVRGSDDSVSFDFSEESDGTQRIVDLLPAMTSLLSQDKVVIVDEIDRSLHPHVSYALFDMFLRENPHNSQLIATTHSENLLTFKLLRKDEIWFVDRDKQGASHLFSLEEFNPRYDKDILTGYMKGRFGAVPAIRKVSNPVPAETE
jgi:hypothetical protein